jgi:hypothetical protein
MLAYLEDIDRVRDSTHAKDFLMNNNAEEYGYGNSPTRINIDMVKMNKEVTKITKGSKDMAVIANRTAGTLGGRESEISKQQPI